MTPDKVFELVIEGLMLFFTAAGTVGAIIAHSNRQHRENVARFTALETRMTPVWEWFLDVVQKQHDRRG